ncbi:MAG: endonuclease/exonuclease/phosphatase family protein [Bacteroidia bacterium]|nr:endonuclease/exonuclease/phosphatase family protein [Bacteroidia bacterium]
MFASPNYNDMRKSLLLICLCLFLQSSGFAQKSTYKVAIVSFYNLENLFDTINDPNINDEEFLPEGKKNYNGEVYLDKLSHLSDVISQIGIDRSPDGPAILGVSEIENKEVLIDLAATPKLKNRNYKIVHHHSPDKRGIDVALFYNPKYFKPTYDESLFVELFDSDSTPRLTRDVLYVAGMMDGELIHLFVNHWPSRSGGEEVSAPGRAKAASVCKAKIDSITAVNPDAKIIVMGDLNDDPVSPSVAVVLGSKGDKDKVKRGGLYNPWVTPYKDGIGTLAYNDSWNLFDQIIISSGFLDKTKDGYFYAESHIFSKPWMKQTSGQYKGYPKRTYNFDNYIAGYSDHFPTFLVFYSKVK